MDAAACQVADALPVVGNVLLKTLGLSFNSLVHGDAFYYIPDHSGCGYYGLTFFNFVNLPNLSVRDMVQGAHNAGTPSLADIGQTNRIVRAIPAHGLYHMVGLRSGV